MISAKDQERFWSRTSRVGDCLIFSGSGNQRSGHRAFYVNNSRMLAHRVAWIIANGPIPEGMCICHHCDNPPCVNPSHLFMGTVADNNADRDRKGRGVMPPRELVPVPEKGPTNHGTIAGYLNHLCRCDRCRSAMATYRSRRVVCEECGRPISFSNVARHRKLHLTGHPDATPLPKGHLTALDKLKGLL